MQLSESSPSSAHLAADSSHSDVRANMAATNIRDAARNDARAGNAPPTEKAGPNSN
ncbi:hypothetical protein MSG28_002574 [Choristoneura fumiferana]|uniref:Uncharacterized protein n=1 Tax=Choristoneura fumiferana TaxID=7141 RepID=A0ACC0JW22_CHOFU|nr:hypothetical protein MSG28_002574 [Choristoneura fumiferana]